MTTSWKVPALSALAGAAIAIAIIYTAALTGSFPQDDSRIRAYLMAHPDIIAAASAKYDTEQDDADGRARQQAIDRLGAKRFFDPRLAFVTGPKSARTTFVEFFDYNCPHCRASVAAVQRFYNAHKNNARFAFIEFPIQGPQSIVAARAAIAARRQEPDKYVAYHFAMMNEDGPVDEQIVFADAKRVGLDVDRLKTDMNDPGIVNEIAETMTLAHTAHIDGTPEFIVDGKSREGEVDDGLLKHMANGATARS
jgi:protein-disulfide isomerase